jgi:LacI family transcriptional regulator
MSRPKLDDIARALRISTATVSNALSGKGRVSDDLIAAIRQKAEELDYVPSLAGRALRTGRSGFIGLVLADIGNPLFPQIARAIENAAADHDVGVLIGDSRGDVHAQTQVINRLVERGADGLIVVPRHGTRIGDIGRPVAVIDTSSTPGNTIAADHWDGGRQMARHLTDLGHKKVVIIGGNSDSNVQNDRVGGLKAGFKSRAEVRVLWIDELERQQGKERELGLVDHVQRGATAFAAVSDLHALRALTELQRAGIAVPKQVSVTGFDDLVFSNVVLPGLTTMRMDLPAIAEIAVARLLDRISNSDDEDDAPGTGLAPEKSVPMTLVVRLSSGPVAAPKRRSSTSKRSTDG